MALPSTPILRAVVGGTCFPGEQWQSGMDLSLGSSLTGVSAGELGAIAQEIFELFRDEVWAVPSLSNDLVLFNDASVNLRYCEVAAYQGGVHVGGQAYNGTPVAGSGTATHPGYTSAVVTTLSDVATRSGQGRRYLPWTAAGIDTTTGQIPSTALTDMVTYYVNWLTALNAMNPVVNGSPTSAECVIVSTTTTALHPITSIRMDSRPDVQRGRVRSTPPLNVVSGSV